VLIYALVLAKVRLLELLVVASQAAELALLFRILASALALLGYFHASPLLVRNTDYGS
jgi:hypothetical protein